jgi:hypothetical protein
MHVSRRAAVALLSTAALAGSATTAVTALGHGNGHKGRHDDRNHHGRVLLDTPMAPSVPADPAIHGVAAGGAPWVLKRGEAMLKQNGTLKVKVRGLVIPVAPGNGTPGPVTTVSASLYCGADSTPAVGTTPAAPIDMQGNARMSGTVTLPAKCLAPIILVHPNGGAAAYIAASGFGA